MGLPAACHALPRAVQLPPALLAVVTGSQGACTGGPPPQWPRRASAGGAALVARDDEDTASAPEAGQGWAAAAAGGPGLAAAAAAAAVSGRALGGRESFGRGPGAENGTLRAPPEGLVPGDAALSIFIGGRHVRGARPGQPQPRVWRLLICRLARVRAHAAHTCGRGGHALAAPLPQSSRGTLQRNRKRRPRAPRQTLGSSRAPTRCATRRS